jgi:hypothetical protein
MASFSKKSKDPTEVALSAIQDALNVRDAEQKATEKPAVVPPPASGAPEVPAEGPRRGAVAPAPSTTSVDDDLFLDPSATPTRDDTAPPRRAANDDRATIGQILHSLQRRPARTPYTIATIFSAAWVVCVLGMASTYTPELSALTSQGVAATPALVALAAFFCAPIAFFFVVAHMLSRSLELRIIAQSMAEVAMRLAEPEAVARESIVTVGQAIRREVAAMGDGVERALARAAELEALVNNEVASLERSYSDNEVRIRGLLESLAQQRETLVGQAEQVRSAISSVHLDLTHDITQVSEAVTERINDSAQRITRMLAEKGDHITSALGSAGDSMIHAIGERGGDLIERLETASAETSGAITNASERLTQSLNFKSDHIGEEFSQIVANVQDMMATRLDGVVDGFSRKTEGVIEAMETRSRTLTDAIVDTSSQIAETIAIRADEVNSTLKSAGESLVLDLSLRGNDVVSKLEQTGQKVTESFRTGAEAVAATVSSRGDAVHDMLAQRLQSFEQMFAQGGEALAERVSRDTSSLGNVITHHLGEFDRTVKTHGGELVDRLGSRTQEVTETMKSYLEGFDGRVTAKAVEVTTSLDQRIARFEEALDSRTQTLNDALNTRVAEIAKTVAEGGQEVVAALDKRINDVTGTITARGAELAATISAKVEDIDRALGGRAAEVANSLDGQIARVEELLIGRAEKVTQEIETRTKTAAEVLNARMEQLATSITENSAAAERSLSSVSTGVASVLKQNASEVERTLLGVSSEVARNFVGRADEIAEAVSKRSAELTRILDDKASDLLVAIGGKASEFTNEVGRVTDLAVKAIESKGFTFTSTMMDNSQQLARIINDAGENATKSVNKTLQDLQHATEDAVEQSKRTATSTVTEILETHGMLSSDTTALFERLREANGLLREVMGGAQENMSSIEHMLSTRVGEFVGTMNQLIERTGTTTGRMDDNITSFYNLTSKVLGDLGALAGHFEGHGRTLVSAVELLDKSNNRAADAINDRRAALDALLSTLDVRAEDLDQRLKRFSGLLDESLAAAEGRARDIARVVADSTSDGVRTIAEQYEVIRSTADDERKRTTSAMRSLYEQSTGDAHAMFRDSLERFTEVVETMKHMAGEMQRELDTTRQELRRGVLELPQETAESAAQMRRVIVDQIEALAELNRIVARHGRSVDAAEPARRGSQEPLLAVVGGGRDNGQRTSGRSTLEVGDTSPPIAATPTSTSRRTEATGSRGSGPGGRGGWLSDLLNRASREPEEAPRGDDRGRGDDRAPRSDDRGARGDDRGPSPRHTIESLDSLSVDIARMIDHDAAAELWDRYNRGERNVFTRRLYTMQGQKTFDEIRKRYRSDRDFKQTVDRYISEFERLLEEASRDDRGQVVVRTYLTSETGKVYTMLAHAAGRFD